MSRVDKKLLYVGGLEDIVTVDAVRSLFLPFGDLRDVLMPFDERQRNFYMLLSNFYQEKHKGFAFVEFEEVDDAYHALDNLNNSEFYGRVLRLNYAKPETKGVVTTGALWEQSSYHHKEDGMEGEAQDTEQTNPNETDVDANVAAFEKEVLQNNDNTNMNEEEIL